MINFENKANNSFENTTAPDTTPRESVLLKAAKLKEKIERDGINWILDTKRLGLSDAEIKGLLHGFGKEIMFAKSYFDKIAFCESEQRLLENPGELIKLRKKYTQFIRDNLSIAVKPNTLSAEQKAELATKKNDYAKKLNTCDEEYEQWILGDERASHFKNILYPQTTFNSPQANIYPSIKIQDSFIHWRSPEYASARLHEQDPKMKFRIYINPDSEHVVNIFQEIVTKATADGLIMTCKIQDRALELGTAKKRTAYKDGRMRGDAIVIYLKDDADTQSILSFLLDIYQETPEIFDKRETNKIPFPIVPGISLGNEPTVSGTSLTSHRVAFLENVARKTEEHMHQKPSDYETRVFRTLLRAEAPRYQINPDNLAFNLT